ncbi:flagellar basal body-associated protein FliL [Shouchella patagoniensis]|uniref:flagellar basal body-associated protein FliL n=1 Tax=Shouchella patagoniensis TaxID=228576 RepID=UPI001474113D|nr:flagellar basal body-associated protein FliL [Shouchella patagoniensis]
MKKNRVIGVILSLFVSGAIVLAGLYLLEVGPFATNHASGAPTIDEINGRSFNTEEAITNLKSGELIRAQFRIQLNDKETLEDIEKRDFQVDNVILLALAETSADELLSAEGITELEHTIQTRLNDHLNEGSVEAVFTTSKVVQ